MEGLSGRLASLRVSRLTAGAGYLFAGWWDTDESVFMWTFDLIELNGDDLRRDPLAVHGGEFFMQLPNYPGVDAGKKFKDINGIVFDVSEHGWG
jgi:hypothetical protein